MYVRTLVMLSLIGGVQSACTSSVSDAPHQDTDSAGGLSTRMIRLTDGPGDLPSDSAPLSVTVDPGPHCPTLSGTISDINATVSVRTIPGGEAYAAFVDRTAGTDRTSWTWRLPLSLFRSFEETTSLQITGTRFEQRVRLVEDFGESFEAPDYSLSPVLECVFQQDDASYVAVWGFDNRNDAALCVPRGGKANGFHYRGKEHDVTDQPLFFEAGRQVARFAMPFDGSNLVWTLTKKTATANKNSKSCSTAQRELALDLLGQS